MARYRRGKKHSRHSRHSKTIPMAIVAPIAIIGLNAVEQYQQGGWKSVRNNTAAAMTTPADMPGFYGPIAIGFGVHYLASKFGVNRALGQAHVPLIRI